MEGIAARQGARAHALGLEVADQRRHRFRRSGDDRFGRTIKRGEAHAAVDPELDRYMHLFALNRGILMTPFHNMALISPDTTQADVVYHTKVFREAVQSLFG